ncbi:MAG: glycosyltransferase family 4 protein [Actinomycetaceae bacterium]|nr:glycosyltransferase family 4 protein [Actinomycetaceae bacterium]
MRIALVSDPYSPRVGGIETQVQNLAHALSDAGSKVTVITATPDGDERGDSTSREGDVAIRRITTRVPFDLPVNPFAGRALREALPAFDVVHIHTGIVSPFARMAVNASLATGTKAVLTWHSHLADATWWYGLTNPLRSWERSGIKLTAVSKAAADAVARSSLGEIHVDVLPNLIFEEPWEASRVRALKRLQNHGFEQSAGEGTFRPMRAVTATRLAPRKRVVPLANLAKKASVEVDIFGGGPQLSQLQEMAKRGAPINLHGKVSPKELARAYEDTDVFVSPVVKEAFGIAALEARACGLPVIYREGAGIEEFITHGKDGLKTRSDDEMAAALAMLANHPERLHAMRRYALEHPISHTWSRGLKQYLDLYETMRN